MSYFGSEPPRPYGQGVSLSTVVLLLVCLGVLILLVFRQLSAPSPVVTYREEPVTSTFPQHPPDPIYPERGGVEERESKSSTGQKKEATGDSLFPDAAIEIHPAIVSLYPGDGVDFRAEIKGMEDIPYQLLWTSSYGLLLPSGHLAHFEAGSKIGHWSEGVTVQLIGPHGQLVREEHVPLTIQSPLMAETNPKSIRWSPQLTLIQVGVGVTVSWRGEQLFTSGEERPPGLFITWYRKDKKKEQLSTEDKIVVEIWGHPFRQVQYIARVDYLGWVTEAVCISDGSALAPYPPP